MSAEPILKVKNLKKYFGCVKAVDGISFEVAKGEVFGFLGPNGAGKTTAIRCILDFIRPQSGEVKIFGFNSKNNNFHLSRERIGYLVPAMNLVDSWSGRDHLTFQQGLRGKSEILSDLLKRFDFDPRPKVKNLSTGNRQKLGLIMALMNKPELLVFDEPTVGLDPILQEEFYKILKEFTSSGVTVFMSSHNLPEVEKVCSQVAMIKSGKILTTQKISGLKGKKIHSVRVTFSEPVKKEEIADRNIEIEEEIQGGYQLCVKHNINLFIEKIAKFKVESIQISQASLEEIFMEFYEK
jgi:ABC-2 type transport system ATP-binding protein